MSECITEDCDECLPEPEIGFAANVEFQSTIKTGERRRTYKHRATATSETSQQDANEKALEKARETVLTRIGYGIRNLFGGFGEERSLVNERLLRGPDSFELVAPIGTSGSEKPWEGRIEKKPWDYRVTAMIPHLDTIEPLKVVVEILRQQTERPYIIIADTGSPPEACEQLEEMRAEDVEIHFIKAHGYRHSSAPVAVAMDLAQSLCNTEFLFHTHADCFLRRDDYLETLCSLVNEKTPVVGYKMSPRDFVRDERGKHEWEWMIGHTATMLHMPTIHKIGATWSMARTRRMGYEWTGMDGWPDTETGFNNILKQNGIKPVFIGLDINYERQTDSNIDHVRSYPGAKLYSESHFQKMMGPMRDAIEAAKRRLRK